MKYCQKCGSQLFDEAVMCPKCGCPAEKAQMEKPNNEKTKRTAYATLCFLAAAAIVVITILIAVAQYNRY